jgi:hypothetical protein
MERQKRSERTNERTNEKVHEFIFITVALRGMKKNTSGALFLPPFFFYFSLVFLVRHEKSIGFVEN